MREEHHDYRGYAGQVAGGVLRPGDDIVVLPGGQRTSIAGIDTYSGSVEAAFPTMSVALRLGNQIDISRGDMIVAAEDQPISARELEAMICWMSEQPMQPRGRYTIKHTTRNARAIVDRWSTGSTSTRLDHVPAQQLALNEIGRVHCAAARAGRRHVRAQPATGSFILIDETTNDTVAAGMIVDAR